MSDPYHVVAVTRRDGWVVLSRHATREARDAALRDERTQFASNGTEDVLEIMGVEVRSKPHERHEAEEAGIAHALVAWMGGATDTQTVAATGADVGPAPGNAQLALAGLVER